MSSLLWIFPRNSDVLNQLNACFVPTSMVSLAVVCLSTTAMYPMLAKPGHAYSNDPSSPLTFCGRWALQTSGHRPKCPWIGHLGLHLAWMYVARFLARTSSGKTVAARSLMTVSEFGKESRDRPGYGGVASIFGLYLQRLAPTAPLPFPAREAYPC